MYLGSVGFLLTKCRRHVTLRCCLTLSRNLTVAKTITDMKTNTETKTKRLRFISIYSIYSGGMVCQSVTEAEDLYYTGATGARSALAQSRSPQKDGWQDPSQETSVFIWNGPMSKWGSTSIEGCVQMFRCKQASGGLLKKCAGNIWIIHSPPFRKECPSPRKNTFPFGPCPNSPPPRTQFTENIYCRGTCFEQDDTP